MRFTDRPKWKRTVLAVICLIGLLAVAGGSFAAYTSQAFQRGVAMKRYVLLQIICRVVLLMLQRVHMRQELFHLGKTTKTQSD